MSEKMKFEAEVQQLLHLVINSLYSNRDIFLRELVANAADAIDKARFESLTNPDISAEWEIVIEPNRKKNILKISDNGIGMTHDEVIRDIGTIAKSGTKAYMDSLAGKDVKDAPDLIGQFGVGFYSAFMVAEKIVLISKKAGDNSPAVRWESSGESEYTVSEDSRKEQGTEIHLHMKGDCKSYLEEWKIRELVKKYSDFIAYPIRMPGTEKKSDESVSKEREVLNSGKALWLKPASEVSDEEYGRFYSHLSHYDNEPVSRIHYAAEGAMEFNALLFIPSKAPFDLFSPETARKGVLLYIKRVFITDEIGVLLPEYLRFMKGVVESNDLPLNVSREILQDNPQTAKIRKNLVRKILAELKRLFDKEQDKYLKFYKEFKNVLKEGVHTDSQNREQLLDLLLFESLNNEPGKMISLKKYCDAMPPAQKDIYCFFGENKEVMESSPHLEFFKKNKIDVLFMTDSIDEWILGSVNDYAGKKIKIAGKSGLDIDSFVPEEKKKDAEKKNSKYSSFLKRLAEILSPDIKEARFSSALTDSPCCLKADEFSPGPHMERLMKAMHRPMPETKYVLELNSEHSLVSAMADLYEKSPEDPRIKELTEILYDQSLLAEGKPPRNFSLFSKRLSEIMTELIKIKDK